MRQPDTYVIIGGGCYGNYYVQQLTTAAERGMIELRRLIVLDRDRDCLVAAEHAGHPHLELVAIDWVEAGRWVLERQRRLRTAHLVPAPLAPHILWEWLARELRTAEALDTEPVAFDGPLPDLPFSQVIRNGTLAVSHAPGMCPVNCVEPRKCPLTGTWRDWEMGDTLKIHSAVHDLYDPLLVFTCQHYAFGVGTIPFDAFFSAYGYLRDRAAAQETLTCGVATVSACHGLLDGLRIHGKGKPLA